jgi:type II secretory pathway predicted ATPase ExeA
LWYLINADYSAQELPLLVAVAFTGKCMLRRSMAQSLSRDKRSRAD